MENLTTTTHQTTTGIMVGDTEVSRDDMVRWIASFADSDTIRMVDTACVEALDRMNSRVQPITILPRSFEVA